MIALEVSLFFNDYYFDLIIFAAILVHHHCIRLPLNFY